MKSLDARKSRLRQQMMAIRKRATPMAQKNAMKLMQRFPKPQGQIIAGYAKMGNELDPAPLLLRLRREGCQILLPCMDGKYMSFRLWDRQTKLVAGAHGVLSPPLSAPLMRPQIVLTPLLAFDRRGNRLGRGGGHYDRTLTRLQKTGPAPYLIGLALDAQYVRNVPAGRYDVQLNQIETPERSWKTCQSKH